MASSKQSRSSRSRRLVSLLGNVALLATSVMLALGLGEVATRLIRPQQTRHIGSFYQPDDTLSFVRFVNLRDRINAGEGWVSFNTDQDGYRVGTDGRREGEDRLLILGDSFMEARAVEYEQSVAGILQEDLSRQLGRPLVVRNNGVSGYGPDHYRLSARRAFARERFKAVLVSVYVGNDIVATEHDRFPPVRFNARPTPRLPKRWTFKDFNLAVTRPILLRLVGTSHLAALIWNATESVRPRVGLAEWDFPAEIQRSHADGPQWAVTARICARIATLADSNHAQAVFVLIPQFAQMNPAGIATYARSFGVDPADVDVDQPNRILGSALRAKGLEVIDALEPLRTAHRAGKPPYGRIDHHLSATGHRIVADLVAPSLLRALQRPAEQSSAHQASLARRHNPRPSRPLLPHPETSHG